jgi:hypothetical protein
MSPKGMSAECPARHDPRGSERHFRRPYLLQTIHHGRLALALKLHVILSSTRPGRVGATIARWFHGVAVEHGKFDPELVGTRLSPRLGGDLGR